MLVLRRNADLPFTFDCSAFGSVKIGKDPEFIDDRSRFVMSAASEPGGCKMRPLWRHALLNQKQKKFAEYAEKSCFNSIEVGEGRIGFVGCGIGYSYIKEAESILQQKFPLLKLGTLPLPEQKVLSFFKGLDKVVVFEEIEPVVASLLRNICNKKGLAGNSGSR